MENHSKPQSASLRAKNRTLDLRLRSRADSLTSEHDLSLSLSFVAHQESSLTRWQYGPCAYSHTLINGFISYHVLGTRTVWVVSLH